MIGQPTNDSLGLTGSEIRPARLSSSEFSVRKPETARLQSSPAYTTMVSSIGRWKQIPSSYSHKRRHYDFLVRPPSRNWG